MTRSEQHGNSEIARLAGIASLLFLLVTAITAQAQTYTVLHTFTGHGDGANPAAGLTMDRAGNFYGTSSYGGYSGGGCSYNGCGVVYKLSYSGSGWTLTPLYTFQGGNDGAIPNARVVFGPDGSLYGTTYAGGGTGACGAGEYTGCGTVFRLQPPARACENFLCAWTETVLYRFNGSDGAGPNMGDLVFDRAGNIYGTTLVGGVTGGGVAFKLAPSSGWTETVLWNFAGGSDGSNPQSGVIFDSAGNLYGTNYGGTAYELTPSGSEWVEENLREHLAQPWGGLVFDPAGNLYGTTVNGGSDGGASIFELTPSNGGWTYSQIYSLVGYGGGPTDSLILDSEGNLYGTSNVTDPNGGGGGVFELMPSNGAWIYVDLHDFT